MSGTLSVIACPNCKREVFTRRDVLYATVDATAQCRACGRSARLSLLSRWLISCVIAIILPGVLLYGDVFYSGHLFVVSLFLIFAAWSALCAVTFPLLSLEKAEGAPIGIKASALIVVALLATATFMDSFMAARFDAERALDDARSPSARSPDR